MAERDDMDIDDDLYDKDNEDKQEDMYLTFHLAGEIYGIDIRHITEIIGTQEITWVPGLPNFVKGVINLRGKVIPVMDVRTRLHLPPRDYDKRTCIIMVNINETSIGLVVDGVREVEGIPKAQVEPPPSSGKEKSYIQGMSKINDEVKIILDIERLLGGNREINLDNEVTQPEAESAV